MDTVRFVLGVILIVGIPPAIVFWLLVHPLAGFWRRAGTLLTYSTLITMCSLLGYVVYRFRVELLGNDFGTQWALIVGGVALYLSSAWLSVLTKRQLSVRTFVGLPEVSAAGPVGPLLQEGIYGIVRHPRYLSVILGTAGFSLFVNYLGAYLMVLGTVPALLLVIHLEERELLSRFGRRYEDYRARVPALVPALRRVGTTRP